MQTLAGCRIGGANSGDYPAPIVDDKAAVQQAKDRLYGLRARREVQAEAAAIQHRHGSRKSGLPPSAGRRPTGARATSKPQAASSQLDLFASDDTL